MEKWSLHSLDFPKIKEMMMEETTSYMGKQRVKDVFPTSDFKEVEQRLLETMEGMDLIRLKGDAPLDGIAYIQPSLRRAKVGGVLTGEELLGIVNTLRAGQKVKKWIQQIDERKASLVQIRAITEKISILRNVQEEITTCIDEQGMILDSASSTLKKVRAQIQTLRERIQHTLHQLLHQPATQKMLQESIVTQRHNRYVMPVKQEYRNVFKGIIHDQSSSGATLFIEPESVVMLNNQLIEKELEEQKEIEKVLKALTELVGQHVELLEVNVDALAQMDFINAKARFASTIKGTCPLLSSDRECKLKKARHPLLNQKEVVPIDVAMDQSQQGMIITGPNTGGKTVTLKTVGLLALMTQSGFPIPAEEGSIMPVFSGVFADIGDEQSIEQSLSTFSGHMKNIIKILKVIDEKSLVLFDEIGAGTDPTEGAALAIAILEYVLQKGSYVISTTHYSELKLFAHTHPKIVNASVEFDVKTLRPTYRLLVGVPGRSNAFAIADRLGLPVEIIHRAQEGLTEESRVLEEMIGSLAEDQKEVSQLRQETEQLYLEAKKLHQEIQGKISLWDEEKQKIRKKARDEAKQFVLKAEREAEEILKEVREWAKNQSETVKEHQWIESKKRFAELVPEDDHECVIQTITSQKVANNFRVNDEVLVLPYNQTGIILERVDDRHFLVQVGPLKMKVNQGQLKKKRPTKTSSIQPMINQKTDDVQPELDLRGKMVEEAILEMDQYLDRALLSGYKQVFLIHGKGTGALRAGIQKFLRNHRYVKSFRLGGHGEGGSGVTVVQFD